MYLFSPCLQAQACCRSVLLVRLHQFLPTPFSSVARFMEVSNYRYYYGPDLPMRADRVTTRVLARTFFRLWHEILITEPAMQSLIDDGIVVAATTICIQIPVPGTRIPYGCEDDPQYNP